MTYSPIRRQRNRNKGTETQLKTYSENMKTSRSTEYTRFGVDSILGGCKPSGYTQSFILDGEFTPSFSVLLCQYKLAE
jgi:hypothetical protein